MASASDADGDGGGVMGAAAVRGVVAVPVLVVVFGVLEESGGVSAPTVNDGPAKVVASRPSTDALRP